MNEQPLGLRYNTVQNMKWLFIYFFLVSCVPLSEQNARDQTVMPRPTIASFFDKQNPVEVDRARILSEAVVPIFATEPPLLSLNNPLSDPAADSVVSTVPLTATARNAVVIGNISGNNQEGVVALSNAIHMASEDAGAISADAREQGGEENRIGQVGITADTNTDSSPSGSHSSIGIHASPASMVTSNEPESSRSVPPTTALSSSSGAIDHPHTSSGNIAHNAMREISRSDVEFASDVKPVKTPVVNLFVPETNVPSEMSQDQSQGADRAVASASDSKIVKMPAVDPPITMVHVRTETSLVHPQEVASLSQYDRMEVAVLRSPTPSSAFAMTMGYAMSYNDTTTTSKYYMYTTWFALIVLVSILCGWLLFCRQQRSNDVHEDLLL